MILVVDNRGFTTRILTHQLGAVHIVSATELAGLDLHHYTHVVVTHGTHDADLSPLKTVPDVPVLAIGVGYQQLAGLYGHTASASAQPVYGLPVRHHHGGGGLFAGVPNPVELISYHAWRLDGLDPEIFRIEATDPNNYVMAFRIRGTNHWGIHADPAALQSTGGAAIVENFVAMAQTTTDAASAGVHTVPRGDRYQLYTREFSGELDTAATFAAVQEGTSAAFWLDSAAAHLGQGEWSLIGTNTGELAQTIRWNVSTNRLDVQSGNATYRLNADVLEYMAAHIWEPANVVDVPGFCGGWVGYLGYEAKQATVVDHMNRWEAPTPDAYWIRPQAFLRYNHSTQITTLFAYQDSKLLDYLEAGLVWGPTVSSAPTQNGTIEGGWRLAGHEYEQRVTQIQELLDAGSAAGICLTDTFTTDAGGLDGLALYRRLRTNNPAPYAGYLRFHAFGDAIEVLSASPEKYLSIDAAGTVESKPIKGTVARSDDPEVDVDVAARMAADPKFQSENLMIADSLRDDLAVVTVAGSVHVPKLMAVESFATVHQLVTTVTGQLIPGIRATEALRAVFPGGSMTGAPKLASLEVLDRLEAGPRGIYSGTIGWIGDNNTAELNVVIRSIVIHDDELSIGAGGAVVVDSDPVAEEQEKQLKARAQMRTIAELL